MGTPFFGKKFFGRTRFGSPGNPLKWPKIIWQGFLRFEGHYSVRKFKDFDRGFFGEVEGFDLNLAD